MGVWMADDCDKPADLDRETLILSLVQRLRSLSDKAVNNGNLASAVQACTREADLLLSLAPEKPSGPGGVHVHIQGGDVGLLRESAVAKLEAVAKRLDEQERLTGCCARCGGPVGKAVKDIPAQSLSLDDQALVEGERKQPPARDPAVPANWYAPDDPAVH
jgi:hypothetical protein